MAKKDEMENTREFPKVTDEIIKENNHNLDETSDNSDLEREENLEVKDDNKWKPKKKKGKKIIIGLLVLIILGVIAFALIKYFDFKKPIKQVWGNTYYEYLKDFKKNDKPYPDGTNIEKPEEYTLHFYDVKGFDDPVMVADYKYNNENYFNVYYIEDEKVNAVNYFTTAHIEFLFSVLDNEYNYYVVDGDDGVTNYKELGSQIKSSTGNGEVDEIQIKDGEEREVKDVDGNTHTISKYDETFINPKVKDEGIEFKVDEEATKLKNDIASEADEYKTTKQTVSGDISKEVQKSLDDLVKKQKELDDMALAVKEKEEEEARKKAEEEAKKGIKVGNYTISYGTYKWIEGNEEAGVLVINNDGTCSIDGKSCTYFISSHDFAQDISTAGHPKTCLAFKTAEFTTHLFPYRDNELGDGDLGDYKLVG